MFNLAIIPARGGSKRIARKNIKEFNGQPILSYPIESAIKSGLFNEVMVSTDDDEIASVALKFNASVPFKRSEVNSNDFATLTDVITEVLLKYRDLGKEYDNICCLLPTAALITEAKLNEAYHMLLYGNNTSVIPVLQFSYPIQRALQNHNGLLHLREPAYLQSRSQDLETFFHDSGQFYWIKSETILKEKTIFTANTGFIMLDETEAQDVDTLLDWEMLKIKYDYLKNHHD